MGLEDYRVLLKPKPRKSVFPDDAPTAPAGGSGMAPTRRSAAAELIRALEVMGFMRQPPARQVGPARLSAPVANEIRLTARQEIANTLREPGGGGEYIVEALVRLRDDPRGGDPIFDSLSMRFAVCQPEGAAWHFLKLVKRMCDTLSLAVVHGEKTYSPEVFWAFRLRANEQIRNQRSMWRELFEGDADDTALAVEETWGHFLKRHSLLLSASEKARAQSAAGRKSVKRSEVHAPSSPEPVITDMEATLPPKAARPVPVRRRETE